ncbi:unnamed protein product [Parascedosporium putredinis]|uniref:Uncharacterized protein n=1 Tax=Parascedosporium putredinis TaxID=1442378 RepID=A0A9P1M8P1_9PEZI|nr:unnamed protein product [Parascedosporium putredinis]CAI7993956.1 unnamed protein product [Parascedosporium putredinis]
MSRDGTWMMHVYDALVNYDDYVPPSSRPAGLAPAPPPRTQLPPLTPYGSCTTAAVTASPSPPTSHYYDAAKHATQPARASARPRTCSCCSTTAHQDPSPAADHMLPRAKQLGRTQDGKENIHILTIPNRKKQRAAARASRREQCRRLRSAPDYGEDADDEDDGIKRER